mgnify:FL=1
MQANQTLIIVDDEPETLRGYEQFLAPKDSGQVRKSSRRAVESSAIESNSEQFNLLLAKSGEEAVELVKNEIQKDRRVAAGFFDVKLEGGMDGLQTIQAIRALDQDIHCVIVTAYHDRTVDEINQLFGDKFKDHWDYLNKPFTQGEILQKARQMLAAWNRKIENEAMHLQIIRSERMTTIAQIARGIGHEFGNILLRIMGQTDLALMEQNPKKTEKCLQIIMTAAERAGVIVHNHQTFAKVQATQQLGNITKAIDEAYALIEHELRKTGVQVTMSYATVPDQMIDLGALGQVFLNLFINASHAMPNGGIIKVIVEPAKDPVTKTHGVVARVIDSGTGIPKEVLPRIFDFAFSTKGEKGSGLGLSVSKEIVEAHLGRIAVTTEVGKGTEFSVWIPAKI